MTKYNGWANRETWLVALHLSNDEVMQNDCIESANRALTQARREAAEREPRYAPLSAEVLLATWLEAYVRDCVVSVTADMRSDPGLEHAWALLFGDMLNACTSRVEWRDIARDILEGVELWHSGTRL